MAVQVSLPMRSSSGVDGRPSTLGGRSPEALPDTRSPVGVEERLGELGVGLLMRGNIDEREILRECDAAGGEPEPVYFLCSRVSEKIACDREDWAFISVALVCRSAEPAVR